MLKMDDEAGGDAKILAVPIDKLSSLYRAIESPRDLPEIQLAQIAHFFEHYKDLEPGKWVRLSGWVGPEEAKREILDECRTPRGRRILLRDCRLDAPGSRRGAERRCRRDSARAARRPARASSGARASVR